MVKLRSIVLVALASAAAGAAAQEWPHVGGDAGATKHSPLDQIHKGNVAELEMAWTFDTGDWSNGTELPTRSAFEATPLAIDGVLYVPSAFSRLFALDAETGEQRWGFDPRGWSRRCTPSTRAPVPPRR
jgi:quinoprotein glucose dehydrogenase